MTTNLINSYLTICPTTANISGGLGSLFLALPASHAYSLIFIYRTSNPNPLPPPDPLVKQRHGELLDPSTYLSAFSSTHTFLLVSYPSIVYEIRGYAHKNAIDIAVQAGVKYNVYTILAFADDSNAAVIQAHPDAEEYLKKTCAGVDEGYDLRLSWKVSTARASHDI